jgi:hypothetical protein
MKYPCFVPPRRQAVVTFDLKSNEGFRSACLSIAGARPEQAAKWTSDLVDFLGWVSTADFESRSSFGFQKRLWDDNPVASLGQGQIPVTDVIQDGELRTWLAKVSLDPLPAQKEEKLALFTGVYEKLVSKFKGVDSRVPHLKIFRVLAALFPGHFSTIADRGALEKLLKAMGRPRSANPVERHLVVMDCVEEALGPSTGAPEEQAFRMQLPWFLYEKIGVDPGEEIVTKPGSKSGEEILVPLPASRRRRGLTPMGGGFQTVLNILESLKDGSTRQELMEYLRSLNPSLKDNSLGVTINSLRSELGAIRLDGSTYVLTDRGRLALENQDASELAEWLLTRVLGIDHILKALQAGPSSRADLVQRLQRVNGGWTSDYVPNGMLAWLCSMKFIRREPDGTFQLEPVGREWAEKIQWNPESLEPDGQPDLTPIEPAQIEEGPVSAAVVLPDLPSIIQSISKTGSSLNRVGKPG